MLVIASAARALDVNAFTSWHRERALDFTRAMHAVSIGAAATWPRKWALRAQA